MHRSTALAIVNIQQVVVASASGDGISANHCYQLALSQWVEVQHPPSTGAIAFGGPDGTTLFVGAVGEEHLFAFSQQNGVFSAVAF